MSHVTKLCRLQKLSRNTALQRAAVPFVLHMYLYIYMLSADTKVNSVHDGLLNLYAVLHTSIHTSGRYRPTTRERFRFLTDWRWHGHYYQGIRRSQVVASTWVFFSLAIFMRQKVFLNEALLFLFVCKALWRWVSLALWRWVSLAYWGTTYHLAAQ